MLGFPSLFNPKKICVYIYYHNAGFNKEKQFSTCPPGQGPPGKSIRGPPGPPGKPGLPGAPGASQGGQGGPRLSQAEVVIGQCGCNETMVEQVMVMMMVMVMVMTPRR